MYTKCFLALTTSVHIKYSYCNIFGIKYLIYKWGKWNTSISFPQHYEMATHFQMFREVSTDYFTLGKAWDMTHFYIQMLQFIIKYQAYEFINQETYD